MPLTHTRTFRVRFYECDAYGHVNHATYLRYMQEAAFDASAAAGYDSERYDDLGTFWLIRETDIEYLHELLYGDSVEVTTWVKDFRRVRSRRAYEFRSVETGDLVAQAASDWVYLDRETARPISIPDDMVAAFFPEGRPESPASRESFPDAPPPPTGAFTHRRQVEWRDVDPEQHVNNAVYLSYMEECGVQVAAAFDWPMERLRAKNIGIIARRHHIEYRQPARLGDTLEVTTWLYDVRRATAMRHYTIRRVEDEALLARAHTRWVCIDLEAGRPRRFPAAFWEDFATNIAD